MLAPNYSSLPSSDDSSSVALRHFSERHILILHDNMSARPRSILVAPARDISSETVNEMLSYGGGSLFVALSPARASALRLSPMRRPSTLVSTSVEQAVQENVCISVEAREGVTTGISAADRACTIRALGDVPPNPRQLVQPGHIFPVEAREGGVLVKHALPEGALDVVRLAGFGDAAAYTEVLADNGEPAPHEALDLLKDHHAIPSLTLFDLTRFRLEREKIVERVAEAKLPTALAGELRAIIYRSRLHSGEHLALIKGEIDSSQPVLTRVQAEYTFGDVFGGISPSSSRSFLHRSLEEIGREQSGVIIYLRKPFRGLLSEQIRSARTKPSEKPTAVMRDFGIGAQILQDLGITKIELLSNKSGGPIGLESFGIEIVRTRSLT